MREKLISELIAARIKELRAHHPKTEQKTTQMVLAEACGVERSTITNIERCNQRPPIHVIYGICDYFGIELTEILPSLQSVKHSTEILTDPDDPVVVGSDEHRLKRKTRSVVNRLRLYQSSEGAKNGDKHRTC